jgi:hypothetical protein
VFYIGEEGVSAAAPKRELRKLWLYSTLELRSGIQGGRMQHNVSNERPKEGKTNTYSSLVIPRRSFKSAPAQKQLGTSLASTTALVGPFLSVPAAPPYLFVGTSFPSSSYSLAIASTFARNSWSNCRDMALRADGRARERMRMRPV